MKWSKINEHLARELSIKDVIQGAIWVPSLMEIPRDKLQCCVSNSNHHLNIY